MTSKDRQDLSKSLHKLLGHYPLGEVLIELGNICNQLSNSSLYSKELLQAERVLKALAPGVKGASLDGFEPTSPA